MVPFRPLVPCSHWAPWSPSPMVPSLVPWLPGTVGIPGPLVHWSNWMLWSSDPMVPWSQGAPGPMGPLGLLAPWSHWDPWSPGALVPVGPLVHWSHWVPWSHGPKWPQVRFSEICLLIFRSFSINFSFFSKAKLLGGPWAPWGPLGPIPLRTLRALGRLCLIPSSWHGPYWYQGYTVTR